MRNPPGDQDQNPDRKFRRERLNGATHSESGLSKCRRVKQLETRVETLIELLANQGGSNNTTAVPAKNGSPLMHLTPSDSNPRSDASIAKHSPPAEPTNICSEPNGSSTGYDPIEEGIIEERHAYRLVQEFKTAFVEAFPFVLVVADPQTLRQKQPFLFHAILAVTSHETPRIQYLLGDELRRQIALIIEHSRKSLEILQGLLVYAAWYHPFYHPMNQQIAIIIQLCVAYVQDLGFSSNQKQKKADDPLPGKRAFLGTYFLTIT